MRTETVQQLPWGISPNVAETPLRGDNVGAENVATISGIAASNCVSTWLYLAWNHKQYKYNFGHRSRHVSHGHRRKQINGGHKLMWVTVCDICKKPVLADQNQSQFCPRCLPHAEGYMKGIVQLMAELTDEGKKRLNRYREQFLQNEVLRKSDALRAVK